MATITPTAITDKVAAVLPMVAAAGGGDVVVNTNGGAVIVIRNANATTARTVTVVSYADNIPPGTAKANKAVTVAANSAAVLGPMDRETWNNTSNQVELTYDVATDLTVGAYRRT